MGAEVMNAVAEDDELVLAAAVDTAASPGEIVPAHGLTVDPDISALEGRDIDVAVDFTHARAAISNVTWALEHGIDCVVGTTGLEEDDLASIEAAAESTGSNVLIAPNFAIGAVLLMKFCEQAAGVFDQCEIIELHHRGKKDSPSGTALATAEMVARRMQASEVPPSAEKEVSGTRGGALGPVRIHSVRLDGLVAHQEVLFGARGQTLTLRHDATDRSCFMPGVILAVKAVRGLPGLTMGIDRLL